MHYLQATKQEIRMVLEKGASSSMGMKIDGTVGDLVAKEPKFKVLIVDDDPVIRMIHAMLMKKHEIFVTHLAENGRQVVDLCQVGAFFDLILMDNDMPIMDGVKATKCLRASGVSSMIVGVTSRFSNEEQQEFMEAGLDFCFAKPLSAEKITFLIEKLEQV